MGEKYCNAKFEESPSKRRKREDRQDFILIVRGSEIPVNRLILEEEFFLMKHRLLYMTAEENRLQIESEDPAVVEKVLNFVTGKYIDEGNGIRQREEFLFPLEEIIQISEVDSLLDLAFRWNAPGLREELFSFLQRNLDGDSFYLINTLAEKYTAPRLRDQCDIFFTQNFCRLCKDGRFIEMEKNKILSALKSPNFKTTCWSVVYESIISWIEYDESRQQFLEELFNCVKLQNLSPDYLEAQVEFNKFVRSNAECLNKVQRAYRQIYETSEGVVMPTDDSLNLKVYYPLSKRSYKLKLEIPCFHQSWIYLVLPLENHLHVFCTDQSVFRLSESEYSWRKIASTCYFYEKFYATIINGDIFILGRDGMRNLCEKYLRSRNLWERIPVPLMETEDYSIASVGGDIYVIGITMRHSKMLPSVDKFNPKDGTVSFASPMHIAIPSPSTAVYEDKIYAAGLPDGNKPFSIDIECLDTKTGIWTTILLSWHDGMSVLGSFSMQNGVCFTGWMNDVASPETVHALSIPATCDHLKIAVLDGISEYNCRSSVVIPANLAGYDVIIKCGKKEFPAHKNVLSVVSDYFKAMFSHGMLENIRGIVEMRFIDSCIARKCIDYIYDAGCPSFNLENVENFVLAATYMQIPKLLQDLATFMKAHLSEITFPHLKTLSHKYSFFEVEDACDDFALENFQEITLGSSECLSRMEKDYFAFLLKYRNAGRTDELEAFKSIVCWVRLGCGARDLYFEELFDVLNLVKIPEVDVRRDIENEELVKKNDICWAKVDKSHKERGELYEVLCILHSRDYNKWDFVVYCPRLQTWKTIWANRDLPRSRTNGTSRLLTIGQHFYFLLMGRVLYKLDYRDDNASWVYVRRTNTPVAEHKTVAVDDCVFVIGSWSIKEFNTTKGKWRTIPVRVERSHFTVVAVEKHIYVLGGTDLDDMQSASTQRYDTNSRMLVRSLSDMQHSRSDAAAAYFGGKIYVTGGLDFVMDDSLRAVEVYNIAHDSWTILPDMNFPRYDHFAFIEDGKLYAVGGDHNTPNTMESYDVDDDDQTWKIEVMPEARRRYVTSGHIRYECLCQSAILI